MRLSSFAVLITLISGQVLMAPAFATHVVPKVEITGKELLTDKVAAIKPGKHGTVVAFMSARCPCSNSHVALLKKLSEEFKNFSFVVVNANADEPVEEARAYFRAAAFPFPVLRDNDEGKLAEEYKALKTPHVFLLDAEGQTLYRGGMTSSVHGETADKQYLRDALVDVETGRSVKVAEGRTLGCMITRGKKK